MSDSKVIESIPSEESPEAEKKEAWIVKLKNKFTSTLLFFRQLSNKLLKRKKIDDDDMTPEESEVSSERSPDRPEDTTSEEQHPRVNWKQKYRIAIYSGAPILSAALGAGLTYAALSGYLHYQNNEINRLREEAQVSENKIEQYTVEVESLKAKLDEKETQLLSKHYSPTSIKGDKKNITGNCILKPGNMSAFKECLDNFNKNQQ